MIVDVHNKFDAQRFAEQAHELLSGLVRNGAALGWLDPPDIAEITNTLVALATEAHGRSQLSIAIEADELVGLGWWINYDRPTLAGNADLEKLAVAPNAQGRGIGRALTEALVTGALAAGIENLTLDLRGNNHAAIRLYESCGFHEYGRLADFVAVGSLRFDRILMVRHLAGPSR